MFARTDRLLLRPAWNGELDQADAGLGSAPAARATDDDRAARPTLLVLERTASAPRRVGQAALVMLSGPMAELFIRINPERRGEGFGREAAAALLQIADYALKLREVVAHPAPGDIAATRFLLSLGFEKSADAMRRRHPGQSSRLVKRKDPEAPSQPSMAA